MSKKTIIVLALLIFSAIAVPLGVYLVQQQQQLKGGAAPATTLGFSPPTAQGTVGASPIVMDIIMTTNQNSVTAAEVRATVSNSSIFQNPTITTIPGSALPITLVPGAFSGTTLTITIGADPGHPALGTNMPIARINLIPIQNGQATITLDTSRIAGIQEGSNVLSTTTPGTVTVGGGATPKPTSTPIPTPTGNVGIGGSSPTPTPTVSPTPTPTPASTCTDTKPSKAPVITSATAGTNSVVITWSAAGDPVTNYGMVYGLAPGEERFGATNIGDKNIRSFTVNQLNGGTTYYFRVRGVNGCAQGDFSNEVAARPTGGATTGIPPGFVQLTGAPIVVQPTILAPTPTTIIGRGPTPTPVTGGLSPGGQKPGDLSTTIGALGIGTLLLLIGGALLFF